MRLLSSLALVFATACAGADDKTDGTTGTPDEWDEIGTDEDGDGVTIGDGDCDDTDPAVQPGRTETCNGIDDNCNDVIDEGTSDSDGDGTCDALDVEECDGLDNDGDGVVDDGFGDSDGDGEADCVEAEDCDGVDNDGDGEIDEGYDADFDGATQCGDTDGEGADCDETDATVYPGAEELIGDEIDNDCDGVVDEGNWGEGDLFITEVMSNPSAVSDPKGEWFEVYNSTDTTVILNGLVITDSDGDWHQISSPTILKVEPASYFVLGADADASANGGVEVGYAYAGLTLENEADELLLKLIDDGAEMVLDAVAWDDGVTFPDPSGASLTLDPSFLDDELNDEGGYWCDAPVSWAPLSDLGSPGEANDPCASYDHDGDGYTGEEGDCDDEDATIHPNAAETDIGVDNDCDGDAEHGPTASLVQLGSSGDEQCGLLLLDATDSADAEGDTPLTFTWELTAAPASSATTTGDLLDNSDGTASFVPDAAGSYTFSVTAWDSGGAASEPAALVIEVSARMANTAPIADAGNNESAASTSACASTAYGEDYECEPCEDAEFPLDGGASTDDDADILSYEWTVASGSGVLSEPSAENPTLRVASASPGYGVAVSETVFVVLKVTDCMGAISTPDTIAITYTCTGE